VRGFIRETAPAWLDHVALLSGFAPPERGAGFTWCDLGCGHGLTAAIFGASHPNGSFHGIDALPAHIESAKSFASEAEIPNIFFHAADFDSAAALNLPQFDYIVSHGVYAWVGESVRQSLRRFIDRHLKPGGMVYLSYNAMPGRAADLPLQRLVRAVGRTMPGDSQQQVMEALGLVRSLTDLKAPALVSSPFAAELAERGDRFSPAYLAHEFMGADWEPLCVTDVRAAFAGIGLQPAGSAKLLENYDGFVLGQAAREALLRIADSDARELARDFLIDRFFRCDVYIRGGKRLEDDERRSRLMQSAFFLSVAADKVEYFMSTPAGCVRFDNPAARYLVRELAAGPRRLCDMAGADISERDLLANALALSAAGVLWPVEGDHVPVAKINEAIRRRAGTPDEIRFQVLPCGTAVSTRW
jgi:SAM-dependent methyltransferase